MAPYRSSLRFDTPHGINHHDNRVDYPQASGDLRGEVDVARGVDDLQVVLSPVDTRRGSEDGDASLLLLAHPVHRSGALVNFTHEAPGTGLEQDALGKSRLACIDVRDDAERSQRIDHGLGRHARRPVSSEEEWMLQAAA